MAYRRLARIPRPIARELSEAAQSCERAVAALEATARAGANPLAAALVAAEAEHVSHRAGLSSAHMHGGGVDRGDVIGIASSLRMLAGRVEQAIFVLGHAKGQPVPWSALTGVLRDTAREVAAAIEVLDGRPVDCDAHLERVDELHHEWRERHRAARAELFTSDAAMEGAMIADMALRRLERVAAACQGAARTVRTVAIKHA